MSSNLTLLDVGFGKNPDDERTETVRRYAHNLISQSFRYWQQDGVVDGDNRGFGVVAKIVSKDDEAALSVSLDDPEMLFDFTYIYGDADRFARRALCKQRSTIRTGRDSADLAADSTEDASLFQKVVTDDDMDSGDVQLGEYPHAGAVRVENEHFVVYLAISGFSGKQDHVVAWFLAEMVLLKLDELRKAVEEFDKGLAGDL